MGKTTTTSGDGGGGEDFFIQEILVWLPVKSLLRFKSVCKSWLELIETPFFIDLHTSFNSSSSSKFGSFILQTIESSSDGSYEHDIKLYMLSSESGSGDHGDGENDNDINEEDDDQKKKNMVFKVDDLGFLPFYKDFHLHDALHMVGSCNGIICLHDPEAIAASPGCTGQPYSNLRDVSLWNPATRQFRILPKSIPIDEEKQYNHLHDFIVFGFDIKTKDYKVLRITPGEVSEEGGCMCQVQVYSLSTDSWRHLEGINSLPAVPTQGEGDNHGIYLNGTYFFVGNKSVTDFSDFMLLSFDFTKEIFTTMQLPDNYNRHKLSECSRHKLDLSYLGDKIVVFTTPINDDCDGYEYYDIWVLNELQGSRGIVNKESWTKLHSFRIKRPPYSKPRCISNNGEFALISRESIDVEPNRLQLFNLVTKEAEKDFLIGEYICRADVYKDLELNLV